MQILVGAAQALEYIHNVARLYHGDVTSSNILIAKDGWGKLVDFGCSIARQVGSSIPASIIVGEEDSGGHIHYMAPEVWMCLRARTASDVYGLSIVA